MHFVICKDILFTDAESRRKLDIYAKKCYYDK